MCLLAQRQVLNQTTLKQIICDARILGARCCMFSPYGLDITENCGDCKMRPQRLFCDLSTEALQAFEAIKCATAYPRGAVLFVEGEAPSGIFVLCKGTVKLSTCSDVGKVLIVRLAKAGDILGLSATLSGEAYELTAETTESCQVNFVRRNEYLCFLRTYPEACFKVAQQISEGYRVACQEARWVGLTRTADQRLAKLLLDWSQGNDAAQPESYVELTFTQEQIGQLIGTTRETVTRVMREFRNRHIIELAGPVLIIRNRSELEEIAGINGRSVASSEVQNGGGTIQSNGVLQSIH
jgi:CRP/FNR family transcriptional regulator, cyclic AMP receptor protein